MISDEKTSEPRSHHYGDQEGYHHIEEAVRVYLHAAPDGARWDICPTTVDGGSLFSDYDDGPLTESCECGEEAACKQAADRLAKAGLPDGEELFLMLAKTLGYDVTKADS